MCRVATMFLAMPLAAGCAAYAEAEDRLLQQARKGLSLVRQAHTDRAAVIETYQRQQAAALDEAFDEDVRSRAELSAEWVIEARRVYALALSQLNRQRDAAKIAGAATTSNLNAIDQAITRLQWLAEVRTRAFRLNEPEEVKPE